MGLFDNDREKLLELAKEANSFKPLDLNEYNVHTLFKRCLPSNNTTELDYSILFPSALGYNKTKKIPIRI